MSCSNKNKKDASYKSTALLEIHDQSSGYQQNFIIYDDQAYFNFLNFSTMEINKLTLRVSNRVRVKTVT